MHVVRPDQPVDTGNHQLIAGVDEAGRGPLAGPVVVAAVIPGPGFDQLENRLDDSKRLNEQRREALFDPICELALAWSVQIVNAAEIDRLNILGATMTGMRRCIDALTEQPSLVLVDGNRYPPMPCEAQAVIKGDQRVGAISAASILAKVHRDRLMLTYHTQFPEYGFDRHKGYPTAFHLQCLEEKGPCEIHRRTFAPVRRLLTPVQQQIR